ncbi:MAG: hypothetical protein EOP84_20115, partial [Verrucomicrobiaceae bacterium]
MSTNDSTDSAFRLSPAGRSALIICTFFFFFIGMAVFWVYREAMRVKNERILTAETNTDALLSGKGEMVWIPSGRFTMGGVGENIPPDETPRHDVRIEGFWMDQTEVTNEQFAKFADSTKYVTVAERPLSAKTTKGLLPEFEGKSASLCFRAPKPGEQVDNFYQWWQPVIGANWRHPEGPDSDLK